MDAAGVGQQRSLKYFQGLARGCWLVSWAWVEACAAGGHWLDEEPFELAGDHFALGAPRTGGSLPPPPFTPPGVPPPGKPMNGLVRRKYAQHKTRSGIYRMLC